MFMLEKGILQVELPPQFRPKTSIVYPPFKNGRYLEEYFYEIMQKNKDVLRNIDSEYIYIPVYWTNIQNHPGFKKNKETLTMILKDKIKEFEQKNNRESYKYFTVVQHDDGPQLWLPKDTLVFGACNGDIPIALIYEDNKQRLQSELTVMAGRELKETPKYLASFIGSITHDIRKQMTQTLEKKEDIFLGVQNIWTNSISENSAENFIRKTLDSKFCLAPRGYGKSSFRFFEAMLLKSVPVYFWDDKEWLPYKEYINYSEFAVSIHKSDISNTYNILSSISEDNYSQMIKNIDLYSKWFTLEGMSRYIISKVATINPHPWDINGLTFDK